MLSKLDESVGLVVEALRKKKMLENSVIVFSTDNGGPPAGFNLNAASNWPLRGTKNTLWEGISSKKKKKYLIECNSSLKKKKNDWLSNLWIRWRQRSRSCVVAEANKAWKSRQAIDSHQRLVTDPVNSCRWRSIESDHRRHGYVARVERGHGIAEENGPPQYRRHLRNCRDHVRRLEIHSG